MAADRCPSGPLEARLSCLFSSSVLDGVKQRQAGVCARGTAEQLCRVSAVEWDMGCKIASLHRRLSCNRVCSSLPVSKMLLPALPVHAGKGDKKNDTATKAIVFIVHVDAVTLSLLGTGDPWAASREEVKF